MPSPTLPGRDSSWAWIGGFGYYWGAYADAAVDEIYAFRRVLTPAEVDCLFQLRSPLGH